MSDSDDDIFTKKKKPNQPLKIKKKTPEQPTLKEVKVQDIFGSGPIKRTEPLVKKANRKLTETGIHSDEEFEKSLLEIDAEGTSSKTKTVKSTSINHDTASKTDVLKNKPIKINVDYKSEEKKEHKHDKELKHEKTDNKDKIHKDKHKESKREQKEDHRHRDLETNDTWKNHKDSTSNGESLMGRSSETKDTDSKTGCKHVEAPHKDRSKANAFGNQKEQKMNIEFKEKIQEKKTPEKKESGKPSKDTKRDFSVFLESDTSVLEDYDKPKNKKKKMNNSLNESGKVVFQQ